MVIARMRTIRAAVDYIKKEDPETMVTEHMIRKLVKNGEIPVTLTGSKQLLNLDLLMEYFYKTHLVDSPDTEFIGIRRVTE